MSGAAGEVTALDLGPALWVYDNPDVAGAHAKEQREAIRAAGLNNEWQVRCSTRMVRAFGVWARVFVVAQVRR